MRSLGPGVGFSARGLPLHPFSSLAAVATCLPPGTGGVAAIAGQRGEMVRPAARDGAEALVPTDALLAMAGRGQALAVSGDVPENAAGWRARSGR
jgi:hypothetical protein